MTATASRFPHPSNWFSWLDSDKLSPSVLTKAGGEDLPRVEMKWAWPFVFLHVGCLGVFLVGWSPIALIITFGLYAIRMFAITAFYHRYFSHKTFKTSRFMQFCFGLLGLMSVQRGPLWWAANHREHHRVSDTKEDLHSPVTRGFWWSQIGWIMSSHNLQTKYNLVPDLTKFPELVFLNRYDMLGPALLMVLLIIVGLILQPLFPTLHTSAAQLVVWGFFVSTIILFHCTSFINSLAHQWGNRPYPTTDQSRNNGFLALLTFGEGWHNNHHRFQNAVRQGFFWWEFDITFYVLFLMSKLGLIWDLKPVPIKVIQERENKDSNTSLLD